MRYELFYNIKFNPFFCGQDVNVFFDSKTHVGALDFLFSNIEENYPFVIVYGPYGSGKSLIKLKFLKDLGTRDNIKVINVTPAVAITYKALLKYLLAELQGKVAKEDSLENLQSNLIEYMKKNRNGKKHIVVMDDVQDVVPLLKKIRHLSDLALESDFSLQFILFAHTSLEDKLSSDKTKDSKGI